MSCYEWERGTIKIPAKEYSKLRKALITEFNRLEDERFEKATNAHAKILAAKKGKRGFDAWAYATGWDDLNLDHNVTSLLFSYDRKSGKYKLHKPKKKDLRKKPISKGATLDIGEACIVLNDDAKTVHWEVPENNHACEYARKHPLANLLFRKLRAMTWTRGSGGKIIGNNEYNRESDYEGGGGNYVVAEYAPPSKKKAPQLRRWTY